MSLSSLIVQRGVASIREVEEALARQVLYGGDLATNLLEIAPVHEAGLAAVVAESFGREAAPPFELPLPSPDVLALVSPQFAVKEGVLPLMVQGSSVVLVVAEPLDSEAEWRLSAELAMPIVQRVALYFRVRQALSRGYRFPIERRYERLLVRLGGDLPKPPEQVAEEVRAAIAPREQPAPTVREGAGEARPRNLSDTLQSTPLGPPVVSVPAATAPIVEIQARGPVSQLALNPHVAVAAATAAAVAAAAAAAAAAPQARPRKKRRGPLSFEVAKVELEEATDREQVLDLFFEFARQYFEFSAIFIVHGDVAEGRECFGPGSFPIHGIGVPLDLPSVFERAKRTRAPVASDLARDGVDATLAADLRRAPQGAVGVVPLVVRTRSVALFWGDDGDSAIDPENLQMVSDAAALVGQAFERLIVRKKAAGTAPAGATLPVPQVVPGAVLPPFAASIPVSPPAVAPAPVVVAAAPVVPAVLSPISSAPDTFASAPPTRIDPEQTLPPPDEPPTDRHPTLPDGSIPPLGDNDSVVSAAPGPLEPPPPAQVVAVRRPQGPPIPREDPAQQAEALRTRAPMRSSRPPAPSLDAVWRPDAAAPAPVAAVPEVWSPDAAPAPVATLDRHDTPVDVWRPDAPVAAPTANVESVEVWSPGMGGSPSPSVPDLAQLEDDESRALVEEINRRDSSPRPPPQAQPAPVALPGSAAIAVSARPPPSSNGAVEALPSVIVNVEIEHADLVERVCSNSDTEAETELVRLGAKAMPAIVDRFPGPILIGISDTSPLPRVSDCGPLLRVVVRQRRVALPFILPYCDDGDVTRRLFATFVLTELPYPEALDAVARRVADDDARVRRVALVAARALAETNPRQIVERFARPAKDPLVPPPRRISMLYAISELRQPIAVPILVSFLTDPLAAVANAANESLVSLTRQDFRGDPRKWSSWWTSNVGRHRIEWLIDSLLHDEPTLRRAAAVELAELTQMQFGYADDGSRRDRERVHLRFREWWLSQGRAKFFPDP